MRDGRAVILDLIQYPQGGVDTLRSNYWLRHGASSFPPTRENTGRMRDGRAVILDLIQYPQGGVDTLRSNYWLRHGASSFQPRRESTPKMQLGRITICTPYACYYQFCQGLI